MGGGVYYSGVAVNVLAPLGQKNREEKELQGENGAFDTEMSTFHGAREVRSA